MESNFTRNYARLSRWAFPILSLVLLWSLFTCNDKDESFRDLSVRLDSSERRTKQLENEKGQLVAQNETLQTASADQLKQLTDDIFALQKGQERLVASVSSYARVTQDVLIRDKTAPWKPQPPRNTGDTGKVVYIPQPADPDLIRVPLPFGYSDSTVAIDGTVQKDGVRLDSIRIPNTLHLRTLEQKTGFLKLGRTTTVQAVNSNPAFRNTGLTQIQVKAKTGAWNRWIKPAIAAGAGLFVGSHFINR